MLSQVFIWTDITAFNRLSCHSCCSVPEVVLLYLEVKMARHKQRVAPCCFPQNSWVLQYLSRQEGWGSAATDTHTDKELHCQMKQEHFQIQKSCFTGFQKTVLVLEQWNIFCSNFNLFGFFLLDLPLLLFQCIYVRVLIKCDALTFTKSFPIIRQNWPDK